MAQPPERALDLGSGAGLPGLVLAVQWRGSKWVLLDASQRRTAYLAQAVTQLELADRITVARGRAEAVAHEEKFRAAFDLVTARGFGPPAVTAECACGFLRSGGQLVVSEPPADAGHRWDAKALATLHMEPGPIVGSGPRFQVIYQRQLAPSRYPRRAPQNRPLF